MARVARRWRAATGAASAATIGLGLLLLACAGVAMAGPRTGANMQTNAIRHLVAHTAPDAKVIVASQGFTQVSAPQTTLPAGLLDSVSVQLRSDMAGLPLAGPGTDLTALTSGFGSVSDTSPSLGPHTAVQLELVYQTGLARNARVVRGRLPTTFHPGRRTPELPIAVTVATARRYGLAVGSSLPFTGSQGVAAELKVTAIVEPVQPSNPFWALDPIESVPSLLVGRNSATWQGGAFIAASELTAIEGLTGTTAVVRWVLPLKLGGLTGSQAIALSSTLPAALAVGGSNLQASQNTSAFTATLMSGFAAALASFAQQAGSISTLLSLLSVSLTAVCVAVLLLAIWLLTDQRYGEFATLRARGASRRQLAWLALRGSLVTVLPGAAIGVAIAIGVTPGGGVALGWWLSGLTLLTVLAGVPLLTARRHKATAGASSREDAPAGKRAAARRLVIEAVLVLASVGGLVVLRVQGLAPGGSDPYTSLAPVLVAVPIAVVVVRCYPLLTRPMLRLTGRRPGVVAFLGLARAIRTAVTAGLPVFGLVLALTLVAFAGMVRGAVVRGEVAASWQQLGADAVVSDPGGLSAAAERSITAVPGVQHAAALTPTSGTLPGNSGSIGIVGVDPAQYGALIASIPGSNVAATVLAVGAAGTVGAARASFPGLATPGLATSLRGLGGTVGVNGQQVRVRLAGQVTATSALTAALSNAQYLVLPLRALGRDAGPPSMMLVVGAGLNDRDLSAVVRRLGDGASVSFRSPALAALSDAPLQRGAYLAFILVSVVAAVLSVLVLLLALMIGGRSRQLTLARMSTMGMSAAQGRWLVILEVVPQVLAAVIGGAACAALLAPLMAPSLDLSVFTGSGASVPVRIEPEFLGGAALALALLALLTLAAQAAIASRTTASALRIGD